MHIQSLHDRPHYSIKSVCVLGGGGYSCLYNRAFFYHPLSVLHTHAEKTYSTEPIFPPRGGSCSYNSAIFLIEAPVRYQQSERLRIIVLGCNGFPSVSTMFNFNSPDCNIVLFFLIFIDQLFQFMNKYLQIQ